MHRFDAAGFPDLLVGLGAPDDAAVYRLNDRQALIQTLDFFPPVVDDPYAFGAITAANAMSDVYAMGGRVLLALNLAAWREDLPLEWLTDILRGGADKVAEAGGVVAGGHTITDKEPKYGLAVTGLVDPGRVFTKGGARPGDRLYLTKPLGSGLITTAGKAGTATKAELAEAIRWMMQLNRAAAEALQAVGARSVTDITGYALLGHGLEMANASGVAFRVELAALPLLPGAIGHAAAGESPGGTSRNRAAFEAQVRTVVTIDEAQDALLFDPQTSGGLLAAVSSPQAVVLEREFSQRGVAYWEIGAVVPGHGIELV